jgi:hypothetical protein
VKELIILLSPLLDILAIPLEPVYRFIFPHTYYLVTVSVSASDGKYTAEYIAHSNTPDFSAVGFKQNCKTWWGLTKKSEFKQCYILNVLELSESEAMYMTEAHKLTNLEAQVINMDFSFSTRYLKRSEFRERARRK